MYVSMYDMLHVHVAGSLPCLHRLSGASSLEVSDSDVSTLTFFKEKLYLFFFTTGLVFGQVVGSRFVLYLCESTNGPPLISNHPDSLPLKEANDYVVPLTLPPVTLRRPSAIVMVYFNNNKYLNSKLTHSTIVGHP